ncbi:MAG: zinc ABC transporter substrate-binding protein, partial [Candidatus Nitrosopolaris sp.]
MNQTLKGMVTLLITMALVSMTTVSPLKVIATNSTSNSSLTTNHTKSNTSVPIISSHTTANNTNQQSNQTKIKVVASFYPIYEFVKAVGGDRIDASVLIPIGAEPHNFDPTIQEVQNANSANLLVYN